MPTFRNNLARADILIGIMHVIGINGSISPDSLQDAFDELQTEVGFFSEKYVDMRKAVRNMLRNGSYKPAGRGKPACEYLARMIDEGRRLPMIHPVVDIFNYLSARHQVPISVWDVDCHDDCDISFELGLPSDTYAFNYSGHEIKLADLIVGCAVCEGNRKPLVSPVKDAHSVKVSEATNRVAAAFYLPSKYKDLFDQLVTSARRFLREAAPGAGIVAGLLESGQDMQTEKVAHEQMNQQSA